MRILAAPRHAVTARSRSVRAAFYSCLLLFSALPGGGQHAPYGTRPRRVTVLSRLLRHRRKSNGGTGCLSCPPVSFSESRRSPISLIGQKRKYELLPQSGRSPESVLETVPQ